MIFLQIELGTILEELDDRLITVVYLKIVFHFFFALLSSSCTAAPAIPGEKEEDDESNRSFDSQEHFHVEGGLTEAEGDDWIHYTNF